ncbi:response regulator transcription factor [Frondihabitans sp. PAMC 28766]|uniref:response regulator n=1 Tax=Frondihabitans sp. PAMC 28766 TaxID=1795630 RepID=UPI00267C248C
MTRVFLVDDHEIVRRGVADLIDSQTDLEVVGEASTVAQGLARIGATQPDVAVLDVHLPDGSGIDLCRDIRSAHPTINCLMLTAFNDDDATLAAVLAGAAGFVIKDIRGQNLLESIRQVASGRQLVSPAASRKLVETITVARSGPASS